MEKVLNSLLIHVIIIWYPHISKIRSQKYQQAAAGLSLALAVRID